MPNVLYLLAGGAVVALLVPLCAIGLLSRLYRKPAVDEAIIRTGLGGQKVCLDGAILAIGSFHQISKVSLSTIRLQVQRDSLLTKDKIRANVVVEFYLRIQAKRDAVLAAARSLGSRAMSNESMKELFEGKATDALRSVVANEIFNELEMHHRELADAVAKILEHELQRNGFELESVVITNLEQTNLVDA